MTEGEQKMIQAAGDWKRWVDQLDKQEQAKALSVGTPSARLYRAVVAEQLERVYGTCPR